jgi:hypothetical protein
MSGNRRIILREDGRRGDCVGIDMDFNVTATAFWNELFRGRLLKPLETGNVWAIRHTSAPSPIFRYNRL